MSSKKFKNVKWDKKRQFKKALAEFNLTNEAFDLIEAASTKNILVIVFNSLLREKKINFHHNVEDTNLIKLYSAYQVISSLDNENKESLLKETNKAIKKFSKPANTKNLQKINYEEEFIKGYKLSAIEKEEFFSNDEYYKKIAEIFYEPFNDQAYYDLAYLLTFYVNLELTFNQYNTPENTDIFLIKLEVQQKMIDVLSRITPENFNVILINLNKWFKKYDKKFMKLSRRKTGE